MSKAQEGKIGLEVGWGEPEAQPSPLDTGPAVALCDNIKTILRYVPG